MKIVYLRVSTEEQNPENQKKEVLSLFDFKDEMFEIFEENKSAFKDDFKREEFNKILKLIKARKINVFAVWSLDRIYRNRIKLKEFFELCKHYKVKVLVYRMPILTQFENMEFPEGFNFLRDLFKNFLLEFLGYMAEEESRLKSDRVKIAYKNHKGKKWGRKKIELNYFSVLRKYNELKSLRKTAEFFEVGKDKISQVLKSSEKTSLEKCNLFINKFEKNEGLKKEQLKDK